MSTLKWSATNADGLLADLDLPPAAYRALLKIRAQSEAGGGSRWIRAPSGSSSVSAAPA